jgi:hypothetical protein
MLFCCLIGPYCPAKQQSAARSVLLKSRFLIRLVCTELWC